MIMKRLNASIKTGCVTCFIPLCGALHRSGILLSIDEMSLLEQCFLIVRMKPTPAPPGGCISTWLAFRRCFL